MYPLIKTSYRYLILPLALTSSLTACHNFGRPLDARKEKKQHKYNNKTLEQSNAIIAKTAATSPLEHTPLASLTALEVYYPSMKPLNGGTKTNNRSRNTSLDQVQQYSRLHPKIKSTTHIIEALHKATNDKDRQALRAWLEAYVEYFKKQILPIKQRYVDEYTILATLEDKECHDILRTYFYTLANKIEANNPKAGEQDITAALQTVLTLLHNQVFQGQTKEVVPIFRTKR